MVLLLMMMTIMVFVIVDFHDQCRLDHDHDIPKAIMMTLSTIMKIWNLNSNDDNDVLENCPCDKAQDGRKRYGGDDLYKQIFKTI